MTTPVGLDSFFILACLLAAGLLAAICDVRTGKIPNWISYPCAGAALCIHALSGPIPALLSLVVMIGVLAALLPIFACNLLRGGDVKVIVAICGLTSYHYVVPFLLYTMLVGGGVAIVVAMRAGTLKESVEAVGAITSPLLHGIMPRSLPFTTRKIPYGVAVLGGTLLTVAAMTFSPALALVKW